MKKIYVCQARGHLAVNNTGFILILPLFLCLLQMIH